VIVAVFVAHGDAEDALGQHGRNFVRDMGCITRIADAGCDGFEESGASLGL